MPIECNQFNFIIPTNSIPTTRNSNSSYFKLNVQHKQNYLDSPFPER